MEKELMQLPGELQNQNVLIEKCEADIEHYARVKRECDKHERRQLRENIHSAVSKNVLAEAETLLLNYQGFDVILPANMLAEKPFVWLRRDGKYYVELGDTETGNLVRIDNFLDSLAKHLEKLRKKHDDLLLRRAALRGELDKKESYADLIEKYRTELEVLDKKLGVEKSE